MRDSPNYIAKSFPGIGRREVFRVFGSFEGISNIDTRTTGFDVIRSVLSIRVFHLYCAVNPFLDPFQAWKNESFLLHHALFDF